MEILLFDLDAVLLNSAGYHRSLVETVRQMALHLGFGDRGLTQEEIDAFEAHDITAEWDSSAICAALLLITAWEVEPAVRLPARPPLGPPRAARLTFPDVRALLSQVTSRGQADALAEAEKLLLGRLNGHHPDLAPILRDVLRQARDPARSLTFRLVQLFNLGSQRFEEIYGEHPGLESESFLERYDLPTLTAPERAALLAAIDGKQRAAAIVTNRPCTAPGGIFNTPEAEIGVAVAGFDRLPFVASGHLGWKAIERGLEVQTFLKPSPVHVLAGLKRSLGEDDEDSVSSAIRLVLSGEAEPSWSRLSGARVCLFEDAAKGHTSARAAAERLARCGVPIDLVPYGIAANADKIETLVAAGAHVYPHLRHALEAAIPGWAGSKR